MARLRQIWKTMPEPVRYAVIGLSVLLLALVVINIIGLGGILYQGRQ